MPAVDGLVEEVGEKYVRDKIEETSARATLLLMQASSAPTSPCRKDAKEAKPLHFVCALVACMTTGPIQLTPAPPGVTRSPEPRGGEGKEITAGIGATHPARRLGGEQMMLAIARWATVMK
jgi:hypothetical protein